MSLYFHSLCSSQGALLKNQIYVKLSSYFKLFNKFLLHWGQNPNSIPWYTRRLSSGVSASHFMLLFSGSPKLQSDPPPCVPQTFHPCSPSGLQQLLVSWGCSSLGSFPIWPAPLPTPSPSLVSSYLSGHIINATFHAPYLKQGTLFISSLYHSLSDLIFWYFVSDYNTNFPKAKFLSILFSLSFLTFTQWLVSLRLRIWLWETDGLVSLHYHLDHVTCLSSSLARENISHGIVVKIKLDNSCKAFGTMLSTLVRSQ